MQSCLLVMIAFASCLAGAEDPPVPAIPAAKDMIGPPASDGWCGGRTAVTLFQASRIAPLVVKGMVPTLDNPPLAPTATVLVDHREVAKRALVAGTFEIRTLVTGEPGSHLVEMVFDATHALPAPDGRAVAALLERIAFERVTDAPESWQQAGEAEDIAGPGAGVGLGDHWYPFETWKGLRFRWAGPGAEIGIAANGGGVLTVEVEAGPGIVGKVGTLRLLDHDGALIDKAPLGKRMAVDLLVGSAALAHQPFTLTVEGGGKSTPGETRVLDVRVFSIAFHAQP